MARKRKEDPRKGSRVAYVEKRKCRGSGKDREDRPSGREGFKAQVGDLSRGVTAGDVVESQAKEEGIHRFIFILSPDGKGVNK